MWSNFIPLLQSEEGCPKGGVVGEKEFLFMINRYFIAYLPPPPTGTPPPGRRRMKILLLINCRPLNYHL